jgi:hypothetical protein
MYQKLVVCEQFEVALKPIELEYELAGIIKAKKEVDIDLFNDSLIEFVESHTWYFGGGVGQSEEKDVININGCISMAYSVEYEEVYNRFMAFLDKNSWSYTGTFKKIIDGYYINKDGSRGKHCFDNE